MAYTDGLYQIEGVNTQCEATGAAVINRLDAAEAPIRFPGGATILEFGLVVTEAYTHANATRQVVSLQLATVEGGTYADVATITTPKASTDTAYGGASAAVGGRIVSSKRSLRVKPGECVQFYQKTAAGGAGGAARPYIIARLDGAGGVNSAAPLTQVSA